MSAIFPRVTASERYIPKAFKDRYLLFSPDTQRLVQIPARLHNVGK